MQKVKKICCRITPRRVMSAILILASAVNLIIVGAAFEALSPGAVPTSTELQIIPDATLTFFIFTATAGTAPSDPWTPTSAAPQTDTSTPTNTPTSALTDTPSPTITACMPLYSWPIYFVQRGDTLYSLARATDSSINELKLANCLLGNRIYMGQKLYVPRLPVVIPTNTFTPSPNTPTVFQNVSACVDSTDIVFSVTSYDPEGISSITASYRIESSQSRTKLPMGADGNTYYGSESRSGTDSTGTIFYSFIATDNLGSITQSIEYIATLQSCYLG